MENNAVNLCFHPSNVSNIFMFLEPKKYQRKTLNYKKTRVLFQIFFRLAELEKTSLEHIWDITKSFNEEFNFRSWVIHYDVSYVSW